MGELPITRSSSLVFLLPNDKGVALPPRWSQVRSLALENLSLNYFLVSFVTHGGLVGV